VEEAVSVPALSGSDSVFGVLSAALDGLALRQRVIADNIANVDTPNFRATTVDFESSLRDAVASGDAGRAGASMVATDTPVGVNGNNVDLRKEMLAATQTQFQYQLMTRAVSDQFTLIKISAGA
jgi:flagellar basal-body rod protein FlgB